MDKETLRKILLIINFTYRKMDRKTILIERYEIILWRNEYLKELKNFESKEGKWHDAYVKNAHQVAIERWSIGLKMPSGKGRSLIITHIGSDSGFLLNGELIFYTKKTRDYYEELNSEAYEKWFGHILEHLEHGSVIVLDSAPYHSRKCELTPQQSAI